MLKPTYLCARCLIDQAPHAVELGVEDPGERLLIVTDVVGLLQKEFPHSVPARLGTRIHQYVRERTGRDPYAVLKKKSNRVAAEIAEGLRREGLTLEKAVRAAVAGNAIDFGVDGSRDGLDRLREELRRELTLNRYDRFVAELNRAERILYLTDNCGEIVFDYLLIELLEKMGKKVIVSPKLEPVLNDATVQDLLQIGFDRIARIVPHAKASIGLFLSEASEEFRTLWSRSDLVIAKGMGHFETLHGTDKKIAYLLKAKCIPVAQSLGVAVGSHILTF